MLVIRMQRTGRKGHAQFRVVVQDSRRTPTSGKIVAALGHYNPHTKETSLNKEKASHYLQHGAQPSDRVIRLLKSEGVKLPKWVSLPDKKKNEVRNPEKRRSTRPAESKPAAPAEQDIEVETAAPAPTEEAPAEENPVEEPVTEAPEITEEAAAEPVEAAEETAQAPESEAKEA